jgi:hypothetical protein
MVMMWDMKHRLLALWCGLLAWLLPLVALAEDEVTTNARFEGYARSVKTDSSSPAPSWMLLILLAGICIAVLFKDAKRTHMD